MGITSVEAGVMEEREGEKGAREGGREKWEGAE